MAYFMWRIISGKHKSIQFCFLPVGHTKFSPDWAFGMMKRKLRHTRVCSLTELKFCFEASSPVSAVNVACLTGSESGEVFVPVSDWQTFLMNEMNYKRIDGIKNLHYLHFHADHPGQVKVHENSESPIQLIHMTTASVLSDNTPSAIIPDGISHDRKQYLFNKIRQFCSEETKDVLCPKPVENTDSSLQHEPIPSTSSADICTSENVVEEIHSIPPPKRRKPVCSNCKQEGHRNSVNRDGTFWCPKRKSRAE